MERECESHPHPQTGETDCTARSRKGNIMYRKILVPLDGSDFAEHALPLAVALARRARASIHLVTVTTPITAAYLEGVFIGSADLEAEAAAQRQGYLEAIMARLRERIDAPITGEVASGE